MSTHQPPISHPIRRLSAVWFADIVGFSSITSVNETLGLRHVELLQRIARRETEESYKGRIVKFIGDAALAEFGSADAAVRAAIAVNDLYTQEAHELGRESTLRIGVHLGEVILADDGDIYGDGVNVASRLQAEAEPGRVLISEDVWRQLRQRPEFMFHSLGQKDLKGISARMGVYDVLLRGTGDAADALHPRAALERTRFAPSRLVGVGVAAGIAAALLAAVLMWPEPTHDDTIALSEWTSAGGPDSARLERFKIGLMDELQIAIKNSGLNNTTNERPSRFRLTGRVRGGNDSSRVVVQLFDAQSEVDDPIWSNTYQTRLTDRFDVHRDLAQEINTTMAGALRQDCLIKPVVVEAPKTTTPAPAAAASSPRQPAVSPREAATASSRRAATNFARAIANKSAKDQYPFGAAVLKNIRSFDIAEANITDVSISNFKVVEYQPERLEADLMLIVKFRSGTGIESLPLPYRATLTRTADTWHLTGFRARS